MPRLCTLAACLASLLLAGCQPKIQPSSSPSATAATASVAEKPDVPADTVAGVREILAKLLNVPLEKIDVDRTFADLGADELDVVELTMEAEERFDVSISEDDVTIVSGPGKHARGISLSRLTPREFAGIVAKSPKLPPRKLPDRPADGSLYEGQTGRMVDLRKLANPKGYVLEPIPSLETIVAYAESKAKRKLTADEIRELEENAMVLALPPEVAAKLREQREKRGDEGKE